MMLGRCQSRDIPQPSWISAGSSNDSSNCIWSSYTRLFRLHDPVPPGELEKFNGAIDHGVVGPLPEKSRVDGEGPVDFETVGHEFVPEKSGFFFQAGCFVEGIVEEKEALAGELTCRAWSPGGKSC